MRVIFVVLWMLSGYAFANCANINDDDQRRYCYAKNGSGSCSAISNSDLRTQCDALKR